MTNCEIMNRLIFIVKFALSLGPSVNASNDVTRTSVDQTLVMSQVSFYV